MKTRGLWFKGVRKWIRRVLASLPPLVLAGPGYGLAASALICALALPASAEHHVEGEHAAVEHANHKDAGHAQGAEHVEHHDSAHQAADSIEKHAAHDEHADGAQHEVHEAGTHENGTHHEVGAHGGHGDDGHGGGHHHVDHKIDWGWSGMSMADRLNAPPLLAQIINFVLFVGALGFLLSRSLPTTFKNRRTTIQEQVEASQAAYQEAKAYLDEYTGKLQSVDAQSAALIEGMDKDGQLEAERTIEKATAYAKQIKEDAKAAIQRESDETAGRLSRELARGILEKAERQVAETLETNKQQQLLEHSIRLLEGSLGGFAEGKA